MGQNMSRTLLKLFAGALLTAVATQADVKLPALFTDHMVLQQGKLIPVWGWADEGEKVTVEFRGRTVIAYAKEGKWNALLPKFNAGGPTN